MIVGYQSSLSHFLGWISVDLVIVTDFASLLHRNISKPVYLTECTIFPLYFNTIHTYIHTYIHNQKNSYIYYNGYLLLVLEPILKVYLTYNIFLYALWSGLPPAYSQIVVNFDRLS